MKMSARPCAALLLLVSSAAFAQEGQNPADPPKTAAPATPDAKPTAARERKVDPAAQALIDKYVAVMHSPRAAGVKDFTMRGEADTGMSPEPATMKAHWTAAGALDVEFTLPKALVEALDPDTLAMMTGVAKDLVVDKLVRPLIDGFLADAKSYDIAMKPVPGATVVKLTPFDKKTTWERLEISFDKDGIATKFVGVPNVDPSDPAMGAYAGFELETALVHAKRGDRYVVETVTAVLPLGEFRGDATYYDGPNGLPLLKVVSASNGGGPAQKVRFFDWVVDGKPVEGTSKDGATTGPITGKTTEPEKTPVEPAKPADAPK